MSIFCFQVEAKNVCGHFPKQFIKIFRMGNEYEAMIQRMFRQIMLLILIQGDYCYWKISC